MSGEVTICNFALRRLGQKRITSLTQDSKEAEHCALFYETCRDSVLRDYPWNFATKYASLGSPLSESPPFKWTYAYSYPSDALNIRQLENAASEFEVVADNIIYTNVAEANCIYTKRVENPERFDPSFKLALAFRLAAELAEPLTGSDTLAQKMWTLYINTLNWTRAVDSSEGQADPEVKDSWLATAGLGEFSTLVTTLDT